MFEEVINAFFLVGSICLLYFEYIIGSISSESPDKVFSLFKFVTLNILPSISEEIFLSFIISMLLLILSSLIFSLCSEVNSSSSISSLIMLFIIIKFYFLKY